MISLVAQSNQSILHILPAIYTFQYFSCGLISGGICSEPYVGKKINEFNWIEDKITFLPTGTRYSCFLTKGLTLQNINLKCWRTKLTKQNSN